MSGEFPNLHLWHTFAPLLELLNMLFQVSTLSPLDCDKHLVILYEGLNILRDVFMIQPLHKLDFFDTIVPQLHIIDVENF